MGRINLAAKAGAPEAIRVIWPQLSETLAEARGLLEFDANRVPGLIEVGGRHRRANARAGRPEQAAELALFLASDARPATCRRRRSRSTAIT
jgi:NAD(P)-dependent dehydrogenase (short-subunit alcohol dehydrogenase family)